MGIIVLKYIAPILGPIIAFLGLFPIKELFDSPRARLKRLDQLISLQGRLEKGDSADTSEPANSTFDGASSRKLAETIEYLTNRILDDEKYGRRLALHSAVGLTTSLLALGFTVIFSAALSEPKGSSWHKLADNQYWVYLLLMFILLAIAIATIVEEKKIQKEKNNDMKTVDNTEVGGPNTQTVAPAPSGDQCFSIKVRRYQLRLTKE